MLDRIDQKILAELSRDGRISNTELARKVGLSATPCKLRVERLVQSGYIQGFHAALNAEKLGRSHVAFVEVTLKQTNQATLEAFNKAVRHIPEIEQCHMIAGNFDYLLKVRTKDIDDYRRIMGEVISALPQVQSTSTNVSMEAVKDRIWGHAL